MPRPLARRARVACRSISVDQSDGARVKLPAPFIQLPLLFDASALAHEIAALDAGLWKPHPQGYPGNSMLPLVAVRGDADDETFDGPMAPTPALHRCPQLMQVFAAIGATIGRSRLMRLSGQAEVTRHADQGYYWTERVRVHVPIVTQPSVRFECGDAAINMAAGECWIFDTWRQHRVINDAPDERIHLVIDTVGGSRFWDLVAAGRTLDAAPANWRATPAVLSQATFVCEQVNVPVVMSPWEMAAHFSLLFEDAQPDAALAQLHHRVARLLKSWQGLWFEHGADAASRPHYASVLREFVDDARVLADGLLMENGLLWFNAMMTMIARHAAGNWNPGAPARAMA